MPAVNLPAEAKSLFLLHPPARTISYSIQAAFAVVAQAAFLLAAAATLERITLE